MHNWLGLTLVVINVLCPYVVQKNIPKVSLRDELILPQVLLLFSVRIGILQ